jgi:hypothetical protein
MGVDEMILNWILKKIERVGVNYIHVVQYRDLFGCLAW